MPKSNTKNLAKKMKTTLIGSLSLENVVQKCEPLLLMKTVPFNLGELKVLDVYLSRINSHIPESCTVTFTKAEYEELMGLTNCDPRTLRKYTSSLLGKIVEVPLQNKGYVQIVLFTAARFEVNEYGQSKIELSCSPQAKMLFFNIENLGYLRYGLKNVLSLDYKHSYLLYLYILKNRFRSSWEITPLKLKNDVFDLKTSKTYESFKYLKRDILDKAVNEINKKTDINLSYELIKKGKSIDSIKFKLKNLKELQQTENQLTLEDVEPTEKTYSNEFLELLGSACNDEFDEKQLGILNSLMNNVNLPPDRDFPHQSKCLYLLQKYKELNYRDSRTDLPKLKNRFAYLKSLIK